MLWCQPNENFVQIINFVKDIECDKSSVGLDQVLETDHNNKRLVWAGTSLTETN